MRRLSVRSCGESPETRRLMRTSEFARLVEDTRECCRSFVCIRKSSRRTYSTLRPISSSPPSTATAPPFERRGRRSWTPREQNFEAGWLRHVRTLMSSAGSCPIRNPSTQSWVIGHRSVEGNAIGTTISDSLQMQSGRGTSPQRLAGSSSQRSWSMQWICTAQGRATPR